MTRDRRGEQPYPSGPVEMIGFLVAFAGIAALLLNFVDAYGFLERSTPERQHALTYWIVAAVMVGWIVWTFALARRRGAGVLPYIWHSLVALVSIAALVLLMVPTIDWRSLNDTPPPAPVERQPNYDPCFSGGDPCG